EIAGAASTCAAVGAAAVIAIAVAIDPEAATRLAATPPAPAPAPATPPAPIAAARLLADVASSLGAAATPALAPPPRRTSRRRDSPFGAASAAGVASFGLLPGAAFGVSVAADVTLVGPLALAVGATFWPETRAADGRFAFGLAAGWLAACATALRL